MDAPEKWNAHYGSDTELVGEMVDYLSGSDLLLFGRTTYGFFAERWPSRTGDLADHFNNLPKVVVSSTLQNPDWNNTSVVARDVVHEVRKLKALSGQNILVIGSHELVQTLMKENLVDEFKLYIYPLTLGEGKRLFEHGNAANSMTLIRAKQLQSGVIASTYHTNTSTEH